MIWYLSLVAVGVATGLHLWLGKRPVSASRCAEVLLLYLLVFFAGLGGLMAFLGHTFKAREIALKIGWQPSPFQFEVAVANLAFGILGIMCIWQRRGFRTATGIGYAVFLLGCAYGHFQDMTQHGNFSPYNVGAVLWFNDLAIPVVILFLLLVRRHLAVTQAATPASNQ
jgi:Family of unknown function (DUF6790)